MTQPKTSFLKFCYPDEDEFFFPPKPATEPSSSPLSRTAERFDDLPDRWNSETTLRRKKKNKARPSSNFFYPDDQPDALRKTSLSDDRTTDAPAAIHDSKQRKFPYPERGGGNRLVVYPDSFREPLGRGGGQRPGVALDPRATSSFPPYTVYPDYSTARPYPDYRRLTYTVVKNYLRKYPKVANAMLWYDQGRKVWTGYRFWSSENENALKVAYNKLIQRHIAAKPISEFIPLEAKKEVRRFFSYKMARDVYMAYVAQSLYMELLQPSPMNWHLISDN